MNGQVLSADGTAIGYRRVGSGPAVLLVHGGMQASGNFSTLADALSADFTVYVPDRRGREMSGPYGASYGVSREVEDLRALIAASGATRVFGLSTGALISLRTALVTPGLERIALYEPPLSVEGSAPVAWGARFDREIAAGRVSAALVTALKGLGIEPVLGRVPRFLLVPFMAIGSRLQGDGSIAALVPTQHYDLRIVKEVAGTVKDYAAIEAEVLLLGGSKGPPYLELALNALTAVLPHSRRTTLPGLDHLGPDNTGDPQRVAGALRDFFLT